MERCSSAAERIHRAVACQMEGGGTAWDVTAAAAAAAAALLREGIAMWQWRQGRRPLTESDLSFVSAAEQCANHLDPDVWRFLGETG